MIDTKNEYTTHLCNLLTPFIYDGFKKMYNEIAFPKALPLNKELSKEDILCFFQKCLRKCKDWNTIIVGRHTIIENEIRRILYECNKNGYPYIEDLLKACLKSHLLLLMYNPCNVNQLHIESIHYENKIYKFFYILYIEISRELWSNPYLMYHKYLPNEIKQNQRECITLIKECIKETMRKILPIKQILFNYLNDNRKINDNKEINDDKLLENNRKINDNKEINDDKLSENNNQLLCENNNINPHNLVNKINNILKNDTITNNSIISDLSNTIEQKSIYTPINQSFNEASIKDKINSNNNSIKGKNNINEDSMNNPPHIFNDVTDTSIMETNKYLEIFEYC